MPDNLQPGQNIQPQGSDSASAPGAFTPAPNPFDSPATTQAPEIPSTEPKPPAAERVEPSSAPEQVAPPTAPIENPQPQVAATPEPQPQAAPAPTVQPAPVEQPPSQPVQNKQATAAEEEAIPDITLVNWHAPEFVQTHKPVGWYVVLVLFFVGMSILAILTQQYLVIGLFALVGLAVAIYANRKPRVLQYAVTTTGVRVGQKSYPYDNFSGYSISNDYNQPVYDLAPTKRFGTLVSLPAPADQQDAIEDVLGDVLPKTESHDDWIDKLFKYLRF